MTISRKNLLKKSNGFLKVVVNKFVTAAQAVTTARNTSLGVSPWTLVLEVREGFLEKEYSVFPVCSDEEEGTEGEEGVDTCVSVHSITDDQ